MQAGLEQAGEELSRYFYIQKMMEQSKWFANDKIDDFTKDFCTGLTDLAAIYYAQDVLEKHMDTTQVKNVSMLQSRIVDEQMDLVCTYDIQMPFPVLGMGALSRTIRCYRRSWVGKDGDEQGGNGNQTADEIVYVGKNPTRYHRDRNCHYLTNRLITVSYEQVDEMRNGSGGKYTACAVCGEGAAPGRIVYIMPEGSHFHAVQDCRAITAYVRAVYLSEVEYLGECSYCGR